MLTRIADWRKLIPLALLIVILVGCQGTPPPTPTGFGIDGIVIADGPCCGGMALQPDGKIVIAGDSSSDLQITRYLSNGTLDTSFGNGGNAIISRPGFELSASSVTIQTDSKIVVAGRSDDHGLASKNFLVVRVNPTGTLDTTFGDQGFVTTDFDNTVVGGDDPGARFDSAHAVLIQPDNKIDVCGVAWIEGDFDFAATRYNPDGSLDNTFGGGDGKVTIGFGGEDSCYDIALQDDGKLVLVGGDSDLLIPPTAFDHDFQIARLNSDGTLDDSFDNDGKRTTGFGNRYDLATAVAIQADGRIVIAGSDGELGTGDLGRNGDHALVARYRSSDGDYDNFFNGDGKYSINSLSGSIRDMLIQPDGKILLLGDHQSPDGDRKLAFYRLNQDSSPDTTFDGDGRAFIDIAGNDRGYTLALQPDGKIIGLGRTATSNKRVLIRLRPDGSFDTND